MDMPGETSKQPIINVLGQQVALGPLRRENLELFHRWHNDFWTLRTLHIPRPSTIEEELALYEGQLAIERRREAAFGMMIGEAEFRGKGFGSEAAHLTLDYAFTGLGLHNILLEVWEYNLAGQRAYTKAGFRECGRRRQAKFMGGRLWDIIYMECLSTEFTNSALRSVMVPDKQDTGR